MFGVDCRWRRQVIGINDTYLEGCSAMLITLLLLSTAPIVLVAEGERFTVTRGDWKPTPQDYSYASHTYGGMWVSQGGLLGAPASSDGAVATYSLAVPDAGKYRVWSKYQAPPYFQYPHRLELIQNGKTVFSHVYGKKGVDRLWSFSGVSNELFWFWGVDHDTAEAPAGLVSLDKGDVELRLITVPGDAKTPTGARFIDFVVLTTEPADTYDGFKPYAVGSPFMNEALAATRLYARFENTSSKPAKLTVSRAGHMQPQYGGATATYPANDVPIGQWSEWFDIGPFCRLAHDEGLTLRVPAAETFRVQFARDAAGKDSVGEVTISADSGAAIVPIDSTWNPKARVKTSKDHSLALIQQSKTWRKASPTKPASVRFYGAFNGPEDWVWDLKHALGYNTALPEKYAQIRPSIVHAHHGSEAAIQTLAKRLSAAERQSARVISFGDEIGLGKIDYKLPANTAKFREWLKKRGVTAADLGFDPTTATLDDTKPRLAWYSNLFNEEERFAAFRRMTETAKEVIGPHVLTGANYSPHHLALCYGPVFQWVDIFKYKGMSMFWTEDYIFSVPETPRMIAWQFAQIHSATKYHGQPIHFYVMPHAPGQLPEVLRRSMLYAVGSGAAHVDNFWVGPPERFTENYVGYHYPETYRALSESMYDTAAIEKFLEAANRRKAKVAVIIGKATDYNESRHKVKKQGDPFLGSCKNADAIIEQTLCRKEQQYQYLALREAGYEVDLITEDDVAEGRLSGYEVVHFAGEWVERRTVATLRKWVEGGGVLYAAGGLGHRNEFDEADSGLLNLLGVKLAGTTKTLIAPRTLLELPLAEATDEISLDGVKIAMYGMRQTLATDGAKVIGTWKDGTPAVTQTTLGKGKAIAVGGLPGMAHQRTGLKVVPYARGGRGTFTIPGNFADSATRLVNLGVSAKKPTPESVAGTGLEVLLLDGKAGTLVTLINWSETSRKSATVRVRLPFAPKAARAIASGKSLKVQYADGVATFAVDIVDAEFVTLER